MSHHEWGDEWFEKNGDDLYAAERYIYRFVKRWSRCRLLSKEKYGTLRYEALFPPGGSYFKTKLDRFLEKWLLKKVIMVDYSSYKIPIFCWQTTWLYHLWYKLGEKTLKIAIKKAAKKYPNVKDEILDDYGDL